VDGVIEATKEIGGNVENVAKVAVSGAIEAAGTIGNTAVKAVTGVLLGVVEGVKEVASAALPTSQRTPSGKDSQSTPGSKA
jgi:hypothetical protein